MSGSVLCQLEIPDGAIAQARASADWLCVNAAPARPFDVEADLVVANRYELEVIGPQTRARRADAGRGGRGAARGRERGRARRARRRSMRSTGLPPAMRSRRLSSSRCSRGASARRRCAAPVLRERSQPRASARSRRFRRRTRSTRYSPLMATPILLDCDPGHDDAIALLLALASPELEVLGVYHGRRQPDAGEDDRERDSRSRLRRPWTTCRSPQAPPRRSCASRTSPRTSTASRGLDGPELPRAAP